METKNWYSLDESAELIAQSLFPESEEEDDKNVLGRYVTKSEHKEALIKSAEAGEAILHSSYLVPIPANEILFHLNHNAGLLKANLENYASNKLGITLILNVAPTKGASMNQLLKFKKFLSTAEACEVAKEHLDSAERVTLYELAQLGDLPLSVQTDSGILDFTLTDKACKAYLQYLITYDPITLNVRGGASIEVVMGVDSDSKPNLNQLYTFKDSQSGEVVELPEFPNGIIGFRSKPLYSLIGLDIPSSENEQAPAPEAKKVKQDLTIRNEAICQDAKNGLTNPQLQKKYSLSKSRISEICTEEKKTIGGSQNVMANVTRRIIKG